MDERASAVPGKEHLVLIAGDLNELVGWERGGRERALCRWTAAEGNEEGKRILYFAVMVDMAIMNKWLEKKQSDLLTYNSGQHTSQIDFTRGKRQQRTIPMLNKTCQVGGRHQGEVEGEFCKVAELVE